MARKQRKKSSARRSRKSTAVSTRVSGQPASARRAASRPAPLLSELTTEALAAELRRRRSELPKLEKKAAQLRSELAAVEARISALGGNGAVVAHAPRARAARPSRGEPRRMRNGQPTIGEQIVEIASQRGGVVAPRAFAEELGKRLSREVNSNFLVQVSLTLARLVKQGRIHKVGRGEYTIGESRAEHAPSNS